MENEEFHDSFDISPETAPPGTSHGNSASQSSTPLVPTREAHGLQDKIAAGISRCYFFLRLTVVVLAGAFHLLTWNLDFSAPRLNLRNDM